MLLHVIITLLQLHFAEIFIIAIKCVCKRLSNPSRCQMEDISNRLMINDYN